MRGVLELKEMRLRGSNPISVWIEIDAGKIVHDSKFPADPANPIMTIDPDERIHEIDFRPVIGLQCMVGGRDERRVNLVYAACMEAQACRVIASVYRVTAGGEVRTFRVKDSAGVFTWSE